MDGVQNSKFQPAQTGADPSKADAAVHLVPGKPANGLPVVGHLKNQHAPTRPTPEPLPLPARQEAAEAAKLTGANERRAKRLNLLAMGALQQADAKAGASTRSMPGVDDSATKLKELAEKTNKAELQTDHATNQLQTDAGRQADLARLGQRFKAGGQWVGGAAASDSAARKERLGLGNLG